MRYVIVSVVKGKCGNFNNNLRKEVYEKFSVKSSKLPAHFTIKSPFETDDISLLEDVLDKFSKENYSQPYKVKGYDHFDDRVVYMKVFMSNEGKILHDNLIDTFRFLSPTQTPSQTLQFCSPEIPSQDHGKFAFHYISVRFSGRRS